MAFLQHLILAAGPKTVAPHVIRALSAQKIGGLQYEEYRKKVCAKPSGAPPERMDELMAEKKDCLQKSNMARNTCKDESRRMDEVFYKPIKLHEREYTQTWSEFEERQRSAMAHAGGGQQMRWGTGAGRK